MSQAIFQGVEGSEWETMHHKYKELHQAVQCNNSAEDKMAKARWTLKEAQDNGIHTKKYELGSVQPIPTRSQVRLALWAIHLRSPTAGRRTQTRRGKMWAGPVISSERCVMCPGKVPESEAFAFWLAGAKYPCWN